MEIETQFVKSCALITVELGLGQDAPTDGESVFPIADMEG